MSHIPETAMKHAQANADKPDTDTPTDVQLVREDPTLGDKAGDAVERARDTIKANPKTSIGIGAAVIAGIAAAVAAPAVIAKVKTSPKKKTAAKKPTKTK